MTGRRPPERWQRSEAAIRAVQVAFDVEEGVITAVRKAAFESGLSTSDQVRVVLGLPVIRQPKRPRLTVSLSPDDYAELAARYGLAVEDKLAIKEQVIADLIRFSESGEAAGAAAVKPLRTPPPLLIEPAPPSPRRGKRG
ncbi:MAG: hypothetical protein K0Q68_3021 [Moraxellaceae bacterium]|jgi:hypothetical protein|nr:hypothetical protein [Moraxellaceae bacterium]